MRFLRRSPLFSARRDGRRRLLVEPLEPRQLLAVSVLDNGPPENRVDIVFVGDGYTAAEIDTAYPAHITTMLDHMFREGEEPYPRYEGFFNVHRVNVVSNESGADKPEDGIFRDTALDAQYSCGGTERLLCISASKANQMVFQDIANDFTVDVKMATVNDTKYGGSGGQYAVYSGGNHAAAEVALHELGHSFNDLADEYGGSAGPYTGSEPWEVNVTKSPTGDKWAQWLGYDQSVIGLIGAYEGGAYYDTGIYRPSQNSKMRNLNRPFDAVSREKIVLDIYELVDPIDAYLDNSLTISDPGVELWVEVVDQDVIDVEWFVDDVTVAGAADTAFLPADYGYAAGSFTVTARAFDPTDWVRTGREKLEQQVTWDVAYLPLIRLSASEDVLSEDGGTATITLTLDEPSNQPLTIDLSSDDPGELTLPDSVEVPAQASTTTFTVTAVGDGAVDGWQPVTITASAAGYVPGSQSLSVTDEDELRVVELTGTSSGFSARLNGAVDPTVLNLYDVESQVFGPADVILVGNSAGTVSGSLVVAGDSVHFIASGGLLQADDYTVTVRGAADAFRSALSGGWLDGNGDGIPGDDYTAGWTVSAASARVVTLPDFVRGPGQPVDVPPVELPDGDDTPGLPVRISQADGVTSLIATIRFDPALLAITGAAAGPDAPAGAQVEFESNAPGEITLTYSGTAAPAGAAELMTLTASVPSRAPYGQAQVLDVEVVAVNGGTLAATADDALHAVAYFGDTTGNRLYSGLDAQRAARVGVQLDGGFEAFPRIDPMVMGDITSNGEISGLDAQRISQQAAGLGPREIPSLPGGGQPNRLDLAVQHSLSSSSSHEGSAWERLAMTAPPVDAGGEPREERVRVWHGLLIGRGCEGGENPTACEQAVPHRAEAVVSPPVPHQVEPQGGWVTRQSLVLRERSATSVGFVTRTAEAPPEDFVSHAAMDDDRLFESLAKANPFVLSAIDGLFSTEEWRG